MLSLPLSPCVSMLLVTPLSVVSAAHALTPSRHCALIECDDDYKLKALACVPLGN